MQETLTQLNTHRHTTSNQLCLEKALRRKAKWHTGPDVLDLGSVEATLRRGSRRGCLIGRSLVHSGINHIERDSLPLRTDSDNHCRCGFLLCTFAHGRCSRSWGLQTAPLLSARSIDWCRQRRPRSIFRRNHSICVCRHSHGHHDQEFVS